MEKDPLAPRETLLLTLGSAALFEIWAIRISLERNLAEVWGRSRGANLSRDLRTNEGGNTWEPVRTADDDTGWL